MRVRGSLISVVRFLCALSLALALAVIAVPAASAITTIVQGPSTSGTVSVAGSAAFTDTLSASSGSSGPVTFVASGESSPTGLAVNSTGNGIVTTGTLAANTYTISGNDSDGSGDTGTWTYTLDVTASTIVQGPSTSGSVSVAGSATFTANLSASSGSVGSVTFTATSAASGLVVTGSQISTTGTLDVGVHSISGTDVDAYGDTGSWSYSLNVTGTTLTQTSPTSASTTTRASSSFNPGSLSVSGATGPVVYVLSVTSPALSLAGGQISTTGSLGAGNYTISGTVGDSYGDVGTWTYTLSVASVGGNTLVQTSSSAATTTTKASQAFGPVSIIVDNNDGPVTFQTTVPSSGISVSSGGSIETTGTLTAGVYTASGTDSDLHGDSGTWTFTLTVTGVVTTVTFDANGGTGTMAPESDSSPSPLTLNTFVRTGYSFVDWNTSPNGSGVRYANGAVYSFGTSETLFAQWKVGKAPSFTVTFAANGGVGTMPPETNNTPTALSANGFTRAGYTFVGWNSNPNGTGTSFGASATYSFKAAVTLYAQWRKTPTFTVRFAANGGRGTMRSETRSVPTALSANRFTRAGYTFVGWNTAANRGGVAYRAGATYPFSSSTTLYAEWNKVKSVVPPPAIDASASFGPFAAKSFSLTTALESQIAKVAQTAKVDRDTEIALVGYGDTLTPANELNEELWSKNIVLSERRVNAVDVYLRRILDSMGLKGVAISTSAAGASSPSGTRQSKSGVVVAALS